jgi:two-component system, chemotaxis family, protein-glutamate methylesterase/glutaminase
MGNRHAVRVLVVDDSATMRRLLRRIIESDQDFAVVGEAGNSSEALEAMGLLRPDVVTLDLNLPGTSGLEVLRRLRHLDSIPVVVITGCGEDAARSLERRVFELGASALIPKVHPGYSAKEFARDTLQALRASASVSPTSSGVSLKKASRVEVVVIGASTGGTEALAVLFANLERPTPPILIAQHMPEGFTAAFASRLGLLGVMRASEARHGDRLLPGTALVAPGGRHLTVRRGGAGLVAQLSDEEKVNGHRPSVDALFLSVSEVVGDRAVGVLLTGMGDDGARGLKRLREVGAHTIAQDERSSVVWGMPRVAVELGAAVEVLPLREIPEALLACTEGSSRDPLRRTTRDLRATTPGLGRTAR